MRQTLRNARAVGCGCRLQDTGVVKGRMRERSLTTAHTAAEMMRRGNLNRQITTDEYNNTMEFFAQTWICTFKNRGGNYILLKCNEKTTKAKLPEEGA